MYNIMKMGVPLFQLLFELKYEILALIHLMKG